MTRQLETMSRVREAPATHELFRILFPESLLYVLCRDGYIHLTTHSEIIPVGDVQTGRFSLRDWDK